ncbi:TetR/AcrR family transcriptional regulator [Legionella fallonii]|nr:TetR/AcrR family transcriptional regulator [Legionella fallonii]
MSGLEHRGNSAMRLGNTKTRALEEARKLLQEVGYNGFSFQHLADTLHIKKQSLYVHFKSKEDLGVCLIEEHRLSFAEWAKTIDIFAPDAQIGAIFEVCYEFSIDSRKICPLSAVGADLNSLPPGMQSALTRLYTSRFLWLINIIEKGQKADVFRIDKSSTELTQFVLAAVLGAQLSARISGVPEQIRAIKQQTLDFLMTATTEASQRKQK